MKRIWTSRRSRCVWDTFSVPPLDCWKDLLLGFRSFNQKSMKQHLPAFSEGWLDKWILTVSWRICRILILSSYSGWKSRFFSANQFCGFNFLLLSISKRQFWKCLSEHSDSQGSLLVWIFLPGIWRIGFSFWVDGWFRFWSSCLLAIQSWASWGMLNRSYLFLYISNFQQSLFLLRKYWVFDLCDLSFPLNRLKIRNLYAAVFILPVWRLCTYFGRWIFSWFQHPWPGNSGVRFEFLFRQGFHGRKPSFVHIILIKQEFCNSFFHL